MEYPIPKTSAGAWSVYQGKTPQNPGLIFERFAPDWSTQASLKKEGLEAVRKATEKVDQALLRAWQDRWEATVKAAHAEPFSLKTDWRFIAGLGHKGPLEVGFTFHRYGFPILPGSSVKGVARAWALIQIAEKLKASDLKKLDEILSADGDKDSKERKQYQDWKAGQSEEVQKLADDLRAVFGTTAVAGLAAFFDAIPAGLPRLELDIMNPHYPDYYSGNQFPTDWQSPIPIYFLTVAANTEFRFAVGWRGRPGDEARRLQGVAREWLIGGLTHLGAGAKTSAGYGYFIDFQIFGAPEPAQRPKEIPKPSTDPWQLLVDNFIRELQALSVQNVAGQIAHFVDRWRHARVPDEYRLKMAQAILNKVESAGRTKKSEGKNWFQELKSFITKFSSDEA